VAAQATAFDRLLERVQPRVAFVVTYYAGLGHAFALACRRRGILCVDVQHCPHDAPHRAYSWRQLPPEGYSTLPALFWTWSDEDSAAVWRWNAGPWHRPITGGHTQVDLLADSSERLWGEVRGEKAKYEREILVALQPIGGRSGIWDKLAAEIESAPSSWRWWIRRHPASAPAQEKEYARLLSLGGNVVAGEGAQTPLPVLLQHMDALVSLASGTAAEAAMFGVPAFFLDDEARDTFPGLLAHRHATMVDVQTLKSAIAGVPKDRVRPSIAGLPIGHTLAEIDRIAADYSGLCREPRTEEIDRGGGIIRERQPPCAA
jgi:hypothetical protein